MDPKIFECFSQSERCAKAIEKIQDNDYHTDSWNILIKEATGKSIDEVEPFYEELLNLFPTCGRYWKNYVEHEMRFKRYEKVSKLFQRSLEEVLSIDLYKCYLNYVREAKYSEPDLIYKAYRYTLDKIGIDPNAISIYSDYIQFLKEREVDGSYLDSQKITAVRKAYQEGVMNPMFHIDTLWKEYISYEHSINPIIAEKMVQDRSRDHMNARRVAKEWEVTIRGLNRASPAIPPTGTVEEWRQLDIWKRYIQWEKSNPLRTENNLIVIKRVSYAYRQCLLCFGHHSNVWHGYSSFLEDQIKLLNDKEAELSKKLLKEETTLYERATRGLMKHNLLMHFAYADFEEIRGDKKKALEIYYNLLNEASQPDSKIHSNEGDKKGRKTPLDLTLVYIQLMRFTRRTEGLRSARAIFKRAREDNRCSHQIFTAAALMEYHCTKDQSIACKIFELGLKKFNTCTKYILSYIQFMNSLNEENNTRVLFERVLTTCPLQPKDTIDIWNSFLEFEAGVGDLTSISKVERRRAVALERINPKAGDSSWAIEKYKFQDLLPCSREETLSELETENSVVTQKIKSSSNSNNNKSQTTICVPDLDQMLPFKPAMDPVPGGFFPPPSAIGNLLSRLPQTFWGPFVDIESLCSIVLMSDFDMLFNNLLETANNKRALMNNMNNNKRAKLD